MPFSSFTTSVIVHDDNSLDGRVVRASASGVLDSVLIPSQVKQMALKIGIHSFPAGRSAIKIQCEEQARKFTCAVGKGTYRDSPILVW